MNRSEDGIYLYDVHKTIDGYIRLRVQESELEYLLGYSSNDLDGSVLEPRRGSENTRSQLKRAAQELSFAVGEVKRFEKLDLKNNKAVKRLELKNRQLQSIVNDVQNAHSLFNSRQHSSSPIVSKLRAQIGLHIAISNEDRDVKMEEQLQTILCGRSKIKALENDLAIHCKSNKTMHKKIDNLQSSLEKRVGQLASIREDLKSSDSSNKALSKEIETLNRSS